MKVAYIGNFKPRHSTENHIARALNGLGHTVDMLQENDMATWDQHILHSSADVMLWTHTGGFPPVSENEQAQVLWVFQAIGRKVIGVHLDRWWGLPRQDQITVQRKAFFHAVDQLWTADGGHDDLWAAIDIEHHWFMPGVSEAECEPGSYNPQLASEVAFVGSWQGGYHPEWPHRQQLVDWLRESPYQVRFFPETNQPAVRGSKLRDLYASVKVVVGDSCLVPRTCGVCGGHGMKMSFDGPNDCGCYRGTEPMTRYCSDRLPETIGRGAYLMHPYVEGVTDGGMYRTGHHMDGWVLGDFDDLDQRLTLALSGDDYRRRVTEAGRAHTLEHHTYEVRMAELLEAVCDG